ncbi:phytanoyl-CoA dioxygenase family protein [Streptomyces sp. NBC_01006]|uniref:phytanoyl-CoA dioxygenase family protein n=1 Tax=Streptomyces sp. NBC_01006 TaxID=2903716 RepID=UPI00386FE707|nr:phytanoyl-CoA dioxygenase family protein [Streptomyces sp. NBC_01006]
MNDPEGALSTFHEHGFAILPSLIPRDTAEHLRDLIEQRYQNPATHSADPEQDLLRGGVSLMRMFEYDRAFRDVVDYAPIADLVDKILGPDCHMISQNALRIPPGQGITKWHIDDELFFPFLTGSPAESAASVPCFSLNVMLALSDIGTVTSGPTQVVPRSHISGSRPPWKPDLPEGSDHVSLLASPGDVYLVNSQTWHRGALNESETTRYLLTTAYGRRFISQRFYPFVNYRMPDDVLDGASGRLTRLLGFHGKGPYG